MLLLAGMAIAQRPAMFFMPVEPSAAWRNQSVRCVLQSSSGPIWYGGRLGLCRYDGRSVLEVEVPSRGAPNRATSSVECMIEDRDGRMWVGCRDGLAELDPSAGTVRHVEAASESGDLLSRPVLELLQDSAGWIWIRQVQHTLRWQPTSGRLEAVPLDDPDGVLRITAFATTSDGRVVACVSDRTVRWWDPRRQAWEARRQTIPMQAGQMGHVHCITVAPDGSCWIGTSQGLFLLAGDAPLATRVDGTHPPTQFVAPTSPGCLLHAGDGRLWIGTVAGLFLLDTGTGAVHRYRAEFRRGGLPDDQINDLITDAGGMIWLATSSGVCRFDGNPALQTFEIRGPPDAENTWEPVCVHRGAEGDLWIGCRKGNILRMSLRTNSLSVIDPPPALDHPETAMPTGLLSTPDGRLWVATRRDGLHRLIPGQGFDRNLRHDPDDPTSLSHNGVLALQAAADGRIWVGTQAGLDLLDPDRGTCQRVELPAAASTRHPRAVGLAGIHGSEDGGLWIRRLGGGLARVLPGQMAATEAPLAGLTPGATESLLFCLAEMGPGQLCLGTANGLLRYQTATGEVHPITGDGVPRRSVVSLFRDDAGNFWAATAQEGLLRLDPHLQVARRYTTDDGLADDRFRLNGMDVGADGRVVAVVDHTVIAFDPRRLRAPRSAPHVELTGLRVFDRPRQLPAGTDAVLQLGPDESYFALEFTAFDYRAPDRTRYAYQLHGFDPQWIESQGDPVARYSNLAPGTYRFHVRAATVDSGWSEPIHAATVVILPAWWETAWFRSAVAALVLLMIGLHTFSVLRIRGQHRRLTAEVAQRQQVERQLQTAEARLFAAFDHVPAQFWLWDRERRCVLQNRCAIDAWGNTVGRSLDDPALPPALAAFLTQHYDRMLAGQMVRGDVDLADGKDASSLTVVLAPVLTAGGPTGGMVIAVDNSELRRVRAEFGQLERRLAQAHKMDVLGRLAGGLAHDFNNFLTGVLGQLDLLRQDALGGGDTAELVDGVDKATQALRRGTALIRRLLALARSREGTVDVVDPGPILQDMVPLIRPLLGDGVALDLQVDPELPLLRAEPGHLEQIVMNLVVNARDAMPQGGTLTLRLRRVVDTDRVMLLLEIRDTGVGMMPDVLERAFEPFFSTKPLGQGTGLGLAIVQGIVTQLGGTLQLDSQPGVGTSFRILLPAADDAAPVAGDDPAGLEQAGRILLCDDEDAVLQLMGRVLDDAGFDVITAADPQAAIAAFRAAHPPVDLLVADMVMPQMNGVELARELWGSSALQRTLFVSGYAAETLTASGTLPREVELLRKPFRGPELVRGVQRMLAIRQR